MSHLFGGHVHDYCMMKAEFDTHLSWFLTVTLLADLGFLGANKDYGAQADIRLPHKKPRKSKNNPSPELTEAQKNENRVHSQKRIVVEHAIGGMKHFHCLTHRIRNQSTSFIDQLLGLGAGLWNFKIA
jgi:hypothetical protein